MMTLELPAVPPHAARGSDDPATNEPTINEAPRTPATGSRWFAQAEPVLASLAERPWLLFFLLLCINAISQPYAGITHDTRLYSVQVLNHVEDGAYSNDLFFRFGSQDQYSLFSRLAAPLTRLLGLHLAFFLIYLTTKSLLYFGMMRLVQRLVPNRAAAIAALIYCMAIPIHYGGQHILNVEENFVTPRGLACGLVLVGLDLLLCARPITSGFVILLAASIHPLMAFGGLLIWGIYLVWTFAGWKACAALSLCACVLAGGVLAAQPIGLRLFGAMDDEWRQAIMHASSFNFPSEWSRHDWSYLAFQLSILVIAIGKCRSLDTDKASLLCAILVTTVAGTLGAILAEQLPYALLLQGQPYRALWLLAFLHLPLAFWICMDWARSDRLLSQLGACALLAYFCSVNAVSEEFVLPMVFFPVFAVGIRGLEREPKLAGWLPRSIQLSLVCGALGWTVYKLALLASGWRELGAKFPETLEIVEVFLYNLGPIVFLVGISALLIRHAPQACNIRLWTTAAACAWIGLQTFYFVLPQTEFYRTHATRYRVDLEAMHKLIHAGRAPDQALPTVYCNLGCVDYIWLDLCANSYFDWWQAGNFMFRREMAIEGRRRACIVAPFELDRYRKIEHQLTQGGKEAIGRFFKTDFNRGPTTAADLARICQEPELDYIILEQRFEGLVSAQSGGLYLYNCRDLRTALQVPEIESIVAVAGIRGK